MHVRTSGIGKSVESHSRLFPLQAVSESVLINIYAWLQHGRLTYTKLGMMQLVIRAKRTYITSHAWLVKISQGDCNDAPGARLHVPCDRLVSGGCPQGLGLSRRVACERQGQQVPIYLNMSLLEGQQFLPHVVFLGGLIGCILIQFHVHQLFKKLLKLHW